MTTELIHRMPDTQLPERLRATILTRDRHMTDPSRPEARQFFPYLALVQKIAHTVRCTEHSTELVVGLLGAPTGLRGPLSNQGDGTLENVAGSRPFATTL